ncbi:hypothetical protein HDV06_006320 [Boothiomyces sp. JEL0866]|nr:hypothetical protein HDV06_006320 [Boothiomyces sp. JEL0866]
MFNSLKAVFQEAETVIIDKVIRPPVQNSCTKGIYKVQTNGLDGIPTAFREFIVATSRAPAERSGEAQLAQAFISNALVSSEGNMEKLEKFLQHLVEEIKPVFMELTRGTDIEMTDHIINELKAALKLCEPTPKRQLEGGLSWPAIPNDNQILSKFTVPIHEKIRECNELLLPKLLKIIPEALQRVVQIWIQNEIKAKMNLKTGIQFLDQFVSKAEQEAQELKDNVSRQVVASIWKGVHPTVGSKLMEQLIAMESSIIDMLKRELPNIPNLNK